jgi:steroid delta-isomerase-like uncharacterized protein
MDRRLILDRAAEAVAALNRGDAGGWVAHIADDVIWRDVAFRMPVEGREALRSRVERYLAAVPDLQFDVTSLTFEDPRLALEWTASGTHRGESLGVPPTGRAIRTYGATITTYDDDGLVIEGTSYWNAQAILHQLGFAGMVREAVATATPSANATRPPVRTSVR